MISVVELVEKRKQYVYRVLMLDISFPSSRLFRPLPLAPCTYIDLDLIFYYSVRECFAFLSDCKICISYYPRNLILFLGINIYALNLSLDDQFTRQLTEATSLGHVQYNTRQEIERAGRRNVCSTDRRLRFGPANQIIHVTSTELLKSSNYHLAPTGDRKCITYYII